MKLFTRLLMVVAAVVALSCTTDVTEDLGVQLNGMGGTTLTLSLEQSRTQLGEKAGDVYPLYWSEGDKISVNGVESGEAVISGENAANASFNVTASAPYCIAYPVAPVGQVLFASEQSYVGDNTFASGVSTMYAYSENGLGIALKHLTGVLKIGVVGTAKLTYAQISTVDRKPIAGAFDFDFVEGAATATSASKSTINYSFGEGVQLSDEPTYLHVVVPAGEYGELYVTLYDAEGGVMYATVKTDETKPLNVGKVREFSNNVAYAPTESVFVVRDVASLKAFAEQAATLDKNVLFVSDVDMTEEAWTPIEGYSNTILGNGYAIKGLTAPLFGTTNASIKGLHLKDVAINSNEAPVMGALACTVTATDTVSPVIEHCSVSGKLTVNNQTFTPVGSNSANELVYAGFVARSYGVKFDHCVNNVAVTVDHLAVAECTASIYPFVAGLVAFAAEFKKSDASVIYTDVTNCTNNAALSFLDKSFNGTPTSRTLYIGGVVSRSGDSNAGIFTDNTNNASITIQSKLYHKDGRGMVGGVLARGRHFSKFDNNVNTANGDITIGELETMYTGGVIGYLGNLVDNFDEAGFMYTNNSNAGDIKAEASNYSSINIGGLFGYAQYTNLTNCSNSGNVSLKTTAATSATGFGIGGLIGQYTGDKGKVKMKAYNLKSSGTVTVDLADATIGNNFRVAGLLAYTHASVNDSSTEKGAKVIIKGKYHSTLAAAVFADKNSETQITVGGFGGYMASTGSYNCVNNADVEIDAVWTSANACFLQFGGMVGRHHNSCHNSQNYGSITLKGDTSGVVGTTFIGGVTGISFYDKTGWTNNGNVNIEGSHGKLEVGGVTGGSNHDFDSAINYGNININATINDTSNIGGVVGYGVYNDAASITNCENYGTITVKGDQKGEVHIGGVAGDIDGKSNKNLINHKGADILVDFTTSSSKIHVGGVIFRSKDALTGGVNDANITVNGKAGGTVYIGGVVCVQNGYNRTDLTNNGKISIGVKINGGSCFVGGICYDGQYNKTWKNCYNNGEIEFTKEFSNTGNVRCGGILGKFETAEYNYFDGCSNSGNITFNGHSDSYVRLGGMIGCLKSGAIAIVTNGFTNSGNITYAGDVAGADNIHIGGIIGCSSSTYKFSQSVSSTSTDESGEEVTTTTEHTWTGNIVNTGTITISGSTEGGKLRAGGLFGILESAVHPFHDTAKFYQLGDIVCTGNPNDKSGVTTGTAEVGGVVAFTAGNVIGVNCYCNINAKTATSVGFITSSARSTNIVASNCKIGGRLIGEWDDEDNTYKTTIVGEDNFFELIYGSGDTTDWTGTDNYDGCSWLTEKPVI